MKVTKDICVTPSSAPFRIKVLGDLSISFQGRELELPGSRKTRALLAYLALSDESVRRDTLCALFWHRPNDPKAALRWALSKLRSVTAIDGHDLIIADRQFVRLDHDLFDVDVSAAMEGLGEAGSASAQDLGTVARALAQVFMSGLDRAGAPAFQTWLSIEREDLRSVRIGVLRRLVDHPDLYLAERLKWAKGWLELAPLDERAASALVSIYRGAGRVEAAASVEDRFRMAAQNAGVLVSPRLAAPPQVAPETPSAKLDQQVGYCTARDGTKIAFAQVGSGAPLVKAANWLNHLELDWDSPIWGATFNALAQNRKFIRYDERGNGMSDWDTDDLSMDAFVNDLEAVVDKLGLEKFPLLGICQGCAMSVAYAARHPERVSALILVSGNATGWRIGASAQDQSMREAVLTLTRLGWGQANPAYRQIFSQTFMPDAPPEDLTWFNEFQRLTTSPDNAVRFQQAFGDIDVREQLGQVDVPTIVFHSRDDQRISFEQGQALADGIKGAEFVPLDSRNHILLGSEPAWQVFVDKMQDFLERHGV